MTLAVYYSVEYVTGKIVLFKVIDNDEDLIRSKLLTNKLGKFSSSRRIYNNFSNCIHLFYES